MNVKVSLLEQNFSNSGSSIEVSFQGAFRRFESNVLGLLQAVSYAMSFGRPIRFWVGTREVDGVDGFETLIKGRSLCIL
jgi:hypothetical protein